MIELFDSHAHLQEPEYEDDLDVVVAEARAAGVNEIVLPGEDVTTSQRAAVVAERFAGVYAAAGFHPHEAAKLTQEGLSRIEALLSQPKVVAVGEIGLDFFRLHSTQAEQLNAFMVQLDLAQRHTMPVIVHCRDAWEALEETLAPWAQQAAPSYRGPHLGVLHYFSSDVATARRYFELGFLISIHTSVTHPKAGQLREVAAALPLEALVIETDSPYGAPQLYRGKRNEPAFVVEAAKKVAEVRSESIDVVANATTANARRLFGLDRRKDAALAPSASAAERHSDGPEGASLRTSGSGAAR
ncbi:MAG TPA: TatD family hydrolase [Dehalococcoidia bacterium]|nr:TatD family hydrolase [Dehalococcoidia bacterium]